MRSGLTIIEVLVLVFIVAVLMGLMMPAGGGARINTKKAQARNDLAQLVTAVKAFQVDNGVYPTVGGTAALKSDLVYGYPGSTRHNSDVINVLRADGADPGPNYHDKLNPRQTIYLDVPYVKDLANPKSGLGTGKETNRFGVTAPGEWYDPWGSPFILVIDTNWDGVCNMGLVYSDFTSTGPNPHNPKEGAAGASLGPDGMIGTKGDGKAAGSDDVVSCYEPGMEH